MLSNMSFLLVGFAVLGGRRAAKMSTKRPAAIGQGLRRLLISAILREAPSELARE
jgi:hypothetical protein